MLKTRLTLRTKVLLAVLVAAAMVAVVGDYLRTLPPPPSNGLQGDSDEAMAALDARVTHTPASQRSAMLVADANSPYPGLRYAAVDALSAMKGPTAQKTLEAAFTDSSSAVREEVIDDLPRLDPDAGNRVLLSALKDDDTWIREEAIMQLKFHSRKQDVPALIGALHDPDYDVVHLAMGVLRHITGKDYTTHLGDNADTKARVIAEWSSWWSQAQPSWPSDPSLSSIGAVLPERSDPAPDFHIDDIDGKPISLSGERGHVVLLNFWGTWCPPCLIETPDLAKLDKTYRARGLDIIGVALAQDNALAFRVWCQQNGLTYRESFATDDILKAYGNIKETPVSVLIDQAGRIRYRWDGERDFPTFSAAVRRLLDHGA